MSRRTRLAVVVGLCAAAAAAAAIGGALLQGDDGSAAPAAATTGNATPPPLELDVYPGEPNAAVLRAAERAYDAGRLEVAAARFQRVLAEDPGSLQAAVGAALAAWPEGTVAELEALAEQEPSSGLVLLYLGLALSATGDDEEARRAWREAVGRDPDTPAAVRADSLLHPDIAPGLPFFVPRAAPPERLQRLTALEQLSALQELAERGGAAEFLLLGSVLQRLGHPVSARRAFDRAVELTPGGVEARVAAAVGRFDKANPSAAFSRLGPLSREHPRAAVVRFHLGVMLLWIRAVEEAERQLARAVRAGPGSVYGREAEKLLATLAQG